MGARFQYARRLVVAVWLRGLNSASRFSVSGSMETVCHEPFFLGQRTRALGDELSLVRQYSNQSQPQPLYCVLGISALLCGGTQRTSAEEECRTTAHAFQTPSLDDCKDVPIHKNRGNTLQESEPPTEVASNVHTAKWRVYTDTGRDLFSKGRLDESEKYLVQAIQEAKEGFGERDPHVASSCNNLAELYRVKKDYAKAEALFLEAVDRLEKAFDLNHVSVSFTLHNLAGTYLMQRKIDQARKCYERALEIKERELGQNHPEYASTIFHLGEVLRLQGMLSDAEDYIRVSISILEEGGVGNSQMVIRRMGRLVEVLLQTGQLKEAEKLQRKILHTLELSQGVESSNATAAAENLAGTLQAAGKLEEAEELLTRSFESRQRILPPTHLQIGVTMFKLASVLIQRGQNLASMKTQSSLANAKDEYERAEQLLRRAIRIAERSWNPVSGDKGSTAVRVGPLVSLLRSLDSLGRLEMHKSELAASFKEREASRKEAEALFRRCLSELNKPAVSQDLASVPDIRRQHMACLKHLADLLSSASVSSSEADSSSKDEAARLLQKSEKIEAELRNYGRVKAM